MPGEIGHVVYAARLLTSLQDSVREPSYWLGTLFPNIRHLNVTSRHPLHPRNITLYSLVGDTDFVTGIRVHTWIDNTRAHFLHSNTAKDKLPYHPLLLPALKITEDRLLYDHFPDWNLIHRLLNNVHDTEKYYVNDEKVIQKWHTTLQNYFSHQPDNDSISELLIQLGAEKHSAREVCDLSSELSKNKKVQLYFHDFWHHLEQILH